MAAAPGQPAPEHTHLPARAEVASAEATISRGRTVYFKDLLVKFRNQCGGCHMDAAQGNFQVTEANFASQDQKILDSITTDGPKFMPPASVGGKPFSQRTPPDSVIELYNLIDVWRKSGKPLDLFTVDQPGEGPAAGQYLLPPEIANALTTIGNCIPSPGLVGTAASKMDQMDAAFAAMKGFEDLPRRLEETDMVALDSETLARNGLVSFAPAYPLFSDDAGKMRHVRVPRRQSIVFDKARQTFTIPDNTRFYKTFLKKVIDREGKEAYRKIETRLIVTRRDKTKPDGSAEVAALFATYIWNETETEAVLLTDRLKDGSPFADLVLTYETDEPKVRAIRDKKPRDLLRELEVVNRGVLRRYAVPSAVRCRECHMGSPDASFSLGFTPLQIWRRPLGEGGVFEAPSEEDLGQLDRFIKLGLITGITSSADIVPLEKSQGDRPPRNEYELRAQAYMLGNCAGCHNPRGFPSIKNPPLRELLDFQPSATGGIFQFPLERYSPRIKRGRDLDVDIPYITPSLRDLERGEGDGYAAGEWKGKWFKCSTSYDCKIPDKIEFLDAPWRSLIFRNVDSPFSYSDDYAIFPHMPRNAPGFDCRASRIMGDWMVSIVARKKRPETVDDAIATGSVDPKIDLSPQSYVEVKPGDPAYPYDWAVTETKTRFQRWREGRRYNHCPDTLDIVDPDVRSGQLTPRDVPVMSKKDPKKIAFDPDNVPDRPHWVPTDLSDPPGDWAPRRFDWDRTLLSAKPADDHKADLMSADGGKRDGALRKVALLESLQSVRVSELRDKLDDVFPVGTWKMKPGCEATLKDAPRAGSFRGAARPLWMDVAKVPDDALVYRASPGAVVFNGICVTCHGPLADSRGLQAETVADLTGGVTRVANLRDGIFGSATEGTRNIDRVFGPHAGLYPKAPAAGVTPALVTADDWAGRYVAWMGLGGTLAEIPQAVLNNVGTSRTMGESRSKSAWVPASPNMLQAAQLLCLNAIPAITLSQVQINVDSLFGGRFAWSEETPLVEKNGDADTWRTICSLGNDPLILVARPTGLWTGERPGLALYADNSYYYGKGYPAGAKLMNDRGELTDGVPPNSTFSLCVARPTDPMQAALAEKALAGNLVNGKMIPWCHPHLFAVDDKGNEIHRLPRGAGGDDGNSGIYIGLEKWAMRGAINAGLAVMVYLQELQRGAPPTPPFDQCQDLRPAAAP